MLKRNITVASLSLGIALLASPPAWATVQNLKSYKQAYPDKDPKTVSCKTCHDNAVGKKGDLNAYGQTLQQHKGEGNAKALTVEDYKAVDQAAPPAPSAADQPKTP